MFTYCTETGQSLIVEERLDGVEADDNDVYTQVKLDTIEEQRLVQVPLNNYVFVFKGVRQISQLLEERD